MKANMPRRPNGPSSLSPGQRPGLACRMGLRPEGPGYAAAAGIAAGHRTPLGRLQIAGVRYPGRCPGLRNFAPLALKALGQLEAEIQRGMKELEGMLK